MNRRAPYDENAHAHGILHWRSKHERSVFPGHHDAVASQKTSARPELGYTGLGACFRWRVTSCACPPQSRPRLMSSRLRKGQDSGLANACRWDTIAAAAGAPSADVPACVCAGRLDGGASSRLGLSAKGPRAAPWSQRTAVPAARTRRGCQALAGGAVVSRGLGPAGERATRAGRRSPERPEACVVCTGRSQPCDARGPVEGIGQCLPPKTKHGSRTRAQYSLSSPERVRPMQGLWWARAGGSADIAHDITWTYPPPCPFVAPDARTHTAQSHHAGGPAGGTLGQVRAIRHGRRGNWRDVFVAHSRRASRRHERARRERSNRQSRCGGGGC